MKKDLHPKMHDVVFRDVSCDFSFLGKSTQSSKEMVKWGDGKEYPLLKVEISRKRIVTGKQIGRAHV